MKTPGLKRGLGLAELPRTVVLLTTLVAFAFQAYVTQTHIHHQTDGFTTSASESGQKQKVPAKDDESSCLLCQAVAHAGQFISPSAIAFGVPALLLIFVAVQAHDIASVTQPSHSWYGRGPPRA